MCARACTAPLVEVIGTNMFLPHFQLISGQHVCEGVHQGSPLVEVEVIGIPADCAKHKSKVITRNALNPIWNEVYTFQVGRAISG